MAIAKMKLVNISSDMEQLEEVLLRFIELKQFHPIEASQFSNNLSPIKGINDENVMKELYSQSLALANKLNLQLGDSCSLKIHYSLEEMPKLLDEIQTQADEIERIEHELREVLTGNIDFGYQYILDNFPGVKLAKPQGTYLLYLDCEEWCKEHGKTMDELEKAGLEVGVLWQDGREFHGAYSIRLNLALPHARVQEAFERLDKYVFNA